MTTRLGTRAAATRPALSIVKRKVRPAKLRKCRKRVTIGEPAKVPIETGVDLEYLEPRLCDCEGDELEQILPSREEADPGYVSYLPLKLGLRLFTKASTPSLLSSVAKRR